MSYIDTFALLKLQDFCTLYIVFTLNQEMLPHDLESLRNRYLIFDAEIKELLELFMRNCLCKSLCWIDSSFWLFWLVISSMQILNIPWWIENDWVSQIIFRLKKCLNEFYAPLWDILIWSKTMLRFCKWLLFLAFLKKIISLQYERKRTHFY